MFDEVSIAFKLILFRTSEMSSCLDCRIVDPEQPSRTRIRRHQSSADACMQMLIVAERAQSDNVLVGIL